MKGKELRLIVVVVLAVLVLTGWSVPNLQAQNTIQIGLLTEFTLPFLAEFSKNQQKAFDMALEEVNAAGGVMGKKLELVTEEVGGGLDQVTAGAEKLISRKQVPLMISTQFSTFTLALQKITEAYKVPLLVPISGSDKITEQNLKYTFRISARTGIAYAGMMVEFLKRYAKPKKVAIFYEQGGYGSDFGRKAKLLVEQAGWEIVMFEGYNPRAIDFKPLLTKAKSIQPDAIMVANFFLDAVLMIRQAKEINLNTLWIGSPGFGFPQFLSKDGAGKDAEYIFSIQQWNPNVPWPGAKEFAEKFRKRYNIDPDWNISQPYYAIHFVADVLKRAGSLDREKIRAALVATDIKESMYGPIKFDEQGQNLHPVLVAQVQNTQYVIVYPTDLARGKPNLTIPPWDKR